jgi:xanthine dehydrogenase accessory factor
LKSIYEEIATLKREGKEFIIITVVEKKGHVPSQIQSKMVVLKDGEKTGTIGGGLLEYDAEKLAVKIFETKEPILKRYSLNKDNEIIDAEKAGMVCGGNVTLFFEYVGLDETLFIFGAGHVSRSLIYHIKNLDFSITVIDNRKEYIQNIESVQNKISGKYSEIIEKKKIDLNKAYIVIATYNHEYDYEVLKGIYKSDYTPKYIGLVASKKKGVWMIERLKKEVKKKIDLKILYTPAGLNIGGKELNEIAISIISEIQAVRYEKKNLQHLSFTRK